MKIKIAGFLFVVVCFVAGVRGQGAAEIVLDHDALGKAPTIKVEIGGKVYPFLFDSGGGVTIITPALAKQIGCVPFGQLTAHNAGGTRIDAKRCDAVEMKVGGFPVRLDAAVMEVMTFFGPDTPEIGGFVSLHTFENRAITIDLAGNRITVETDASLAARVKDMKRLESRLSRQMGGGSIDMFVAVNSPKGKMWFEVDTGNFSTILIAPHAQEMLGINFDAPNRAKTTKPVRLDIAGLGTVEGPARERQMIYDGMINHDTLAKMLITMDLRDGRMWAKMLPQQQPAAVK